MFKRPGDPPEFNNLYAIPAGAALATYALGHAAGFPEMQVRTMLIYQPIN